MFFAQLSLVVALLVVRGSSQGDMPIPRVTTSTAIPNATGILYDEKSPQSLAESSYATIGRLARVDEASSAEFYSTEFLTTDSSSGRTEDQTPGKKLQTTSSAGVNSTADIGTVSTAENVNTIYYTTSPQSPAYGDYPSTVGMVQASQPSSAERQSTKFETTQSAFDAAESQTRNKELETPAAYIEDVSTAHFGTLSAAEHVNTLYDRTSPQSSAPSDYPTTGRLALADEASSTKLPRTAFETTQSASDAAESQTPNRELETPLALTQMTSIADIGTLSTVEYINTLYDEASTQSTAPSDYATTERLVLANEASSVTFYSPAFATTNSTAKLAEDHTPNVEQETASASTAVSSIADVKIASAVKIVSTIYDDMPHQSTSESSYTMMDITAKNNKASPDELYSTESAFINLSSHTEQGTTSSGEADTRSASNTENGITFNANDIKVGEVSSDSAPDYSVVGYSVGALILLAAVAPTVFMLAHSQGLISHCTGRLTMSPVQSNPA